MNEIEILLKDYEEQALLLRDQKLQDEEEKHVRD